MENYIISTPRLGLRKWIEADFAPFAEMNKDKEVMKYYPKSLTEEETYALMQRINLHFTNHGFGLYAVEKINTQEFIGYTGFIVPTFESIFTPCIEIGWRLKKEEWNKGYATEAATACLNYGFHTLQFDKLYSFTSTINTPSERVMQKIGMLKIGEFDHPIIPRGHLLRRHVLYVIEKDR